MRAMQAHHRSVRPAPCRLAVRRGLGCYSTTSGIVASTSPLSLAR